jgi:hypothetical protein
MGSPGDDSAAARTATQLIEFDLTVRIEPALRSPTETIAFRLERV